MSDKKPQEEVKKSNPVGRPTIYTEQIQLLADTYINEWELYKVNTDEDGNITRSVNSIPSIAGLSLTLGIHRATVYLWAKKHDLFIDTLEVIQQKQEIFLMHHGLTKGYDSGFAKFMAINVTKYRDKIEHSIEKGSIAIKIDGDDEKL
jgi:hypothetical protein